MMFNRLIHRDMARYPGVNLTCAVAHEQAAVFDGMFFALLGVPACAAVYDDPVR